MSQLRGLPFAFPVADLRRSFVSSNLKDAKGQICHILSYILGAQCVKNIPPEENLRIHYVYISIKCLLSVAILNTFEHCVDCVLQSVERGKYEHEKKNGLISRES